MLQYSAVDPPTLELLKQLMAEPVFQGLRLVGGTALALQLGHRKSIDLDLFGQLDEDIYAISQKLNSFGSTTLLNQTKNIHVYLVKGIKVDLVNYPYTWLEDPILSEGLRLAGNKDIAAMKLAAITGRGTKKDFIDLYYLLKQYSLSEMISFYENKFSDGSTFLVLKSLSYFEDADQEQSPRMLLPANWEKIKLSIISSLKEYLK
ncbi:MAG: nucleotidyl transferase AbiEii/AbiGii toxin family protein [Bacteroidota bacterium]